MATRVAMGKVLNATLPGLPGVLAGAADLTGNTGTKLDGEAGAQQSRERPGGRQLAFGVREHAMGASMVGMAMHGGVLPVGGTFFVFSDYMRPSVRLAAISQAHCVFVWTHDSVGVGEDGPTHQPIEHLAALRAMPGLRLIRPADANEVAAAWAVAVDSDGPTALVLSRQSVPVLAGTKGAPVAKGAYVLEGDDDPEVILLGTGSEVQHCVAAAATLRAAGRRARVVSMPSTDLFAAQDQAYQQLVLPTGIPTVSVEAAATFGWHRWADRCVGIDRFGASAPGDVVMSQLGITPDHVVAEATALLAAAR
jgi:transketolase